MSGTYTIRARLKKSIIFPVTREKKTKTYSSTHFLLGETSQKWFTPKKNIHVYMTIFYLRCLIEIFDLGSALCSLGEFFLFVSSSHSLTHKTMSFLLLCRVMLTNSNGCFRKGQRVFFSEEKQVERE
jgi:hypothetical protein